MNVTHANAAASKRGPAEWFTGTVWLDEIAGGSISHVRALRVTFEPGARTAWHTHPLGQTLLVTAGCGRVQSEGGPIREIRPGDTVWISPGEKHWHGAGPDTAMTHLAMQEALDGTAVDWLELSAREPVLGDGRSS